NYEIKNSATYSTDTGFMYWKSTKNDPGHVIMDDFDMKNIRKWNIWYYKGYDTFGYAPCGDIQNYLKFQLYDGTTTVQLFNNDIANNGEGINTGSFVGNLEIEKIGTNTYFYNNSGSPCTWTGGTVCYTGTVDVSSLDPTKKWKLRLYMGTGDNGNCEYVNQESRILKLNFSGFGQARNSSGHFSINQNYSIQSGKLFEAPNNISRVKLVYNCNIPVSGNALFYVSDNASIWNKVVNDTFTTLTTTSNELYWYANISTNDTTKSVYCWDVELDIIPSSAENVTVNVGDDTTVEFNMTGSLNSTTSPQIFSMNITNLHNYNSTYTSIKISTDVAGSIMIHNFNLNSSVNPVSINSSDYEDCSSCNINFSYNGNNFTVKDLRVDFLGSWNYTANSYYDKYNITYDIQVKYSKFNLYFPKSIYWLDVIASSNDYNVSPKGQSSTSPIRNVTNEAYDDKIDLYVRTNDTISCMNITFYNSSNRTVGTSVLLNTSYQIILSNISVNSWKGIWQYYNLRGCSALMEFPWFYYSAICSDCYFDSSFLEAFPWIE
ncbi:MAG: hypothetical protein ACTSX6_04530, partial [Candidatus Heimdallarchaeaceae archaeon]